MHFFMFVCTGIGVNLSELDGDLVGREGDGPVNKKLFLQLANVSINSRTYVPTNALERRTVTLPPLSLFVGLSGLKMQLIMPLM